MIVHTEILGSVGRVWLTEESDGKWLNIGAETEGGLKKVIRLRESDARWLRASLKDMDRQFDSE